MHRRAFFLTPFCAALAALPNSGNTEESDADLLLPDAKPIPKLQVLPLPHDQAAIVRDGVELTRYHFSPTQRRPFLYPIIGPSGRSLTRMGHPHATFSHSHHNSVWTSHHDVNGENFWADDGAGRIVPRWIVQYTDGDGEASIVAVNHWIGRGDKLHLIERRGMKVVDLPNQEWLLIVDLQFEPDQEPTTLGKTPFGLMAVRMAKTIGTADGGGLIRNSEGHSGEQGDNGVFWKRARWVDYSGLILPGVNEGITLLDHPANPNHPSHFHVRSDGWMGSSLTFDGPRAIEPGKPLRLRYGLYVHRGVPSPERINRQWEAFAKTKVEELPNFRK